MVEDESSTGYEQGAALEGPDKGSILHIEADNFDGLANWTPGHVQLSSSTRENHQRRLSS